MTLRNISAADDTFKTRKARVCTRHLESLEVCYSFFADLDSGDSRLSPASGRIPDSHRTGMGTLTHTSSFLRGCLTKSASGTLVPSPIVRNGCRQGAERGGCAGAAPQWLSCLASRPDPHPPTSLASSRHLNHPSSPPHPPSFPASRRVLLFLE